MNRAISLLSESGLMLQSSTVCDKFCRRIADLSPQIDTNRLTQKNMKRLAISTL